jgi:hypothetical protein
MAGIVALALVPALVAGSQTLAQTPPLPTVDQVLEKYIAGVGGRAAIQNITSVTAKGTIEIPSAGITGTIELWQKAPNKAATRSDLVGVGVQREAFDGTTAWAEDGQMGLRDRTGAELADAKRSAMFPRELRLKEVYPTLTVKGREQVGARDTVVVEGVPAEGAPARLFFDVETGLLARQIVTRQTPQGPIEVTVSFDDYRAVDGVKRAFTILQDTAMFNAIVKFTEIRHNAPVDDATFSKPK